MDARTLLVNQHIVLRIVEVFENEVEEVDEFGFWDQLDPLYEDVNISPLEEDVVPFARFNHIQHIANVKLLLLRSFVVLVDLAEHADDREQGILLQVRLKLQIAREIGLEKLVLDERKRC